MIEREEALNRPRSRFHRYTAGRMPRQNRPSIQSSSHSTIHLLTIKTTHTLFTVGITIKKKSRRFSVGLFVQFSIGVESQQTKSLRFPSNRKLSAHKINLVRSHTKLSSRKQCLTGPRRPMNNFSELPL